MFTSPPALTIQVQPGTLPGFTSLLQAGILLGAGRGTSIGAFLSTLPGFTSEYISAAVQTIFLNGTATDDMETPLDTDTPVLAISAAMPGLAGAIFRRNSLHAALRTVTHGAAPRRDGGAIIVTLKLFNAIARDRGVDLLTGGVTIRTDSLSRFLDSREDTYHQILAIDFDNEAITLSELSMRLQQHDTIFIRFSQ